MTQQLAIIEARDLQIGDIAVDPPTGAHMEIVHVRVSDTGVFLRFADHTLSTLPLATQVTIRARITPVPPAATGSYDQAKAIHRDRIDMLIRHYRDGLAQPRPEGVTAEQFGVMVVSGQIQATVAQFEDVDRRAQFAMRGWAFAIQALAEDPVQQLIDIPAMPPEFASESDRLVTDASGVLDELLGQYQRCTEQTTASGGGDADIVASFGLYLDNDLNPGLLSLILIAAIRRIRAQGEALAAADNALTEQGDRDAAQRPAQASPDNDTSHAAAPPDGPQILLCAFEVQQGDILIRSDGTPGEYITGRSDDPGGALVHLWYAPGQCHTYDRAQTLKVLRPAAPDRA